MEIKLKENVTDYSEIYDINNDINKCANFNKNSKFFGLF